MKMIPWSRVGAIIVAGALVVSVAPAAVADDGAIVSVSTPELLTLPDADGVRDATSIQVSADAPTSVVVTVSTADRASTLLTLPAVELTVDNGLVQTVQIPVTGLTAGALVIDATPESGTPGTAALTVGSGQPVAVSQTLSRATIYTWTGATYRSATATVGAVDETGAAVPFAGSVVATSGSTVRSYPVASTDGSAATATIAATSLPYGTATVVSTVAGAGSALVSSAEASLTVKAVAVASTSLKASVSTVYPAKDGYRDSVKLSVSTTTTTAGSIPARGSVKITRSGKTIKSWTLTSTKAWSATWDGRVATKIVPGTYKVSVAIKGPQGAAQTSSTYVTVKSGKLVTRTASKTVDAKALFKTYYTYDEWGDSYCAYNAAGDVGCEGYDAFYGDGVVSLVTEGSFAVPDAVRNAQKYGSARARVTLSTTILAGTAAWGYGRAADPTDRSGVMRRGDYNHGWTALPATTSRLYVSAALGEYSFFVSDRVKVEWQYRVMVTS